MDKGFDITKWTYPNGKAACQEGSTIAKKILAKATTGTLTGAWVTGEIIETQVGIIPESTYTRLTSEYASVIIRN